MYFNICITNCVFLYDCRKWTLILNIKGSLRINSSILSWNFAIQIKGNTFMMVFKASVKFGYTYITKLISLRKLFLALHPWDITKTFYVFKVIIKWDNLKKKCEICTAAYWSSVSRAQCKKDALLALQPVLRVYACLCGHRACWHHVRRLS